MSGDGELLAEVLELSRSGDVDAATNLLRERRAAGPLPEPMATLLFQLLTTHGPDDEAEPVLDDAVAAAKTPLSRSNWSLRRGLYRLERSERDGALADLQLVLKLRANEGHVEQARAALLKVAALPKTSKTNKTNK